MLQFLPMFCTPGRRCQKQVVFQHEKAGIMESFFDDSITKEESHVFGSTACPHPKTFENVSVKTEVNVRLEGLRSVAVMKWTYYVLKAPIVFVSIDGPGHQPHSCRLNPNSHMVLLCLSSWLFPQAPPSYGKLHKFIINYFWVLHDCGAILFIPAPIGELSLLKVSLMGHPPWVGGNCISAFRYLISAMPFRRQKSFLSYWPSHFLDKL